MNHELFVFGPWIITPWKLIGYAGVLMFGGRWVVQLVVSHIKKRPYFPRLFWYMSLCGSLLLLLYFTFGKSDSVGIFSNLFPACVASYNLFLEITHRRRKHSRHGSRVCTCSMHKPQGNSSCENL